MSKAKTGPGRARAPIGDADMPAVLYIEYLDVNDLEPWGRRAAELAECIGDRLPDVFAIENVARLQMPGGGGRIDYVDIISEGSESWDGASWMHASCQAEFDNTADESAAIHNVIAGLIYARRREFAEVLGTEDLPYLSRMELAKEASPLAYMDVSLPWRYGGTVVSFSWPVSLTTPLSSIGKVALTLQERVRELDSKLSRIINGVEIVKKPLREYTLPRRTVFISHSIKHRQEVCEAPCKSA